MSKIRQPVVAGIFYPADKNELTEMVDNCIKSGKKVRKLPKAIIAPHAGYIYSGPIAGSAYAVLKKAKDKIKRVIVLGPSHRVGFRGIAMSDIDGYNTPLGTIPVDRKAMAAILTLPSVGILEQAFNQEHSVEVHFPFLQRCLTDFAIVPLVVGQIGPEQVAEVLEQLWGGKETLIVISTDLSHYHDYDTACAIDEETSKNITKKHYKQIKGENACGHFPMNGLLYLAQQKKLAIKQLDQRNSGDTQGDKSKVVGYGAYHVTE